MVECDQKRFGADVLQGSLLPVESMRHGPLGKKSRTLRNAMNEISKTDSGVSKFLDSSQSRHFTRIFYGMGGVTAGMVSVGLGMFVLVYYSRVLGLSAGLVGTKPLITDDLSKIEDNDKNEQNSLIEKLRNLIENQEL